MYVEQLRWLPAISYPKPIHLPPTHFAFLEEGVFLAKMIKKETQDLFPFHYLFSTLLIPMFLDAE